MSEIAWTEEQLTNRARYLGDESAYPEVIPEDGVDMGLTKRELFAAHEGDEFFCPISQCEREKPRWFRVEVSDHKGQIVAIESEILSGRDIGEQERATILRAIEHLEGFIGLGRSDFIVEALERDGDE